MDVTVLGPESSAFRGEADSLVVPAFDGEVGILPRHAPFLTLLGDGVLTVKQGSQIHRFAVRGGFVQVVSNRVRVVAEFVAPAA
jgi:F-type H+-transporting ATPase subunit epsilon